MVFGVFLTLMAVYITVESKYIADFDLRHVQMPEKCTNLSFCTTKNENYPQELINDIIIRNGHNEITMINYNYTKIEDRDEERPVSDCVGTADFDYIYEIEDSDGLVRFVVQSEQFKWKIRTEMCVKPGPIDERSELFAEEDVKRYGLACAEMRVDFSFLVLSLDGTTFETVQIKDGIPMFCMTVMQKPV